MRLQRLHRFWLAVLLAAGLCANALADEFPPPATVKAQLKTVVLLPVDVPSGVPRREDVVRRLEEAISARFTNAGITVIPAATTRALEQKLMLALGGLYDPRTGDMDKVRADTFDEHYFSEIRRSYPADAWVHASVVLRMAPAGGVWMQWDGVRESAIGSANNAADILHAPTVTGSLPAVSLAVVVARPDRQPLYARYGGLQPLQYFAEASAAKSMFGLPQQIDMVPTDEAALLSDPAREQRAIAIALDPLLLSQAEQDAAKAGPCGQDHVPRQVSAHRRGDAGGGKDAEPRGSPGPIRRSDHDRVDRRRIRRRAARGVFRRVGSDLCGCRWLL
jgi:hypothetical protein